MPTYDYRCEACGHEMEAFHSMSAPPLKDCPACGTPSLKRQIGAGAGLIFKGSGFYQTDYRSDSYKQAAKSESGTGTVPAGKTEGGSAGTTSKTESASKPAASTAASAG